MGTKTIDPKAEEAEWRENFYANHIGDPGCRAIAIELARNLRSPGDPHVTVVDLEVATKYLLTCVLARSVSALSTMGADQVAAVWAQGAYGAACYRAQRGARQPNLEDRRKRGMRRER
jgi:hypothetical protein